MGRFLSPRCQSAIAAEVIQHLDGDADQKRTHPALYLRCKESLRKKKARQARTKRIRSFMRRILGGLLRHSERNPRPKLRHSARIVVDGLPESMREPPHTVKPLPKTAESAAAQPMAARNPTLRALPHRLSTPVQKRRVTPRQRERSFAMNRASVSSDTPLPT